MAAASWQKHSGPGFIAHNTVMQSGCAPVDDPGGDGPSRERITIGPQSHPTFPSEGLRDFAGR
jgi:hypothetical protein